MDHVVVICMVKPESKEVTSQLNVIFKRTLSNPISSKQTKPLISQSPVLEDLKFIFPPVFD